MNYYEELGIRSDADEEEIRKAHRRLVKLMHPDQHRDQGLKQLAETQMRRLNSIVATLLNPEERREYDEQLHGGEALGGGAPQSTWRSVPWWIASTLGAIVLTVSAVWFWADRVGSGPGGHVTEITNSDTTQRRNPDLPGQSGAAVTTAPADSPAPPSSERSETTVTVPTPAVKEKPEPKPVPAKPKDPNVTSISRDFPPLPPIKPASKPPIVPKAADVKQSLPAAGPVKPTQAPAAPLSSQPVDSHKKVYDGPSNPNPLIAVNRLPKANLTGLQAPSTSGLYGAASGHEEGIVPLLKKDVPEPSIIKNSSLGSLNRDPLEGEWVYAPTEPEKRKAGFYPPEFINLKLIKQPDGMHGEYSARYNVSDTRPVSPDVNFVLKSVDKTARKYVWTASNGSRGTLAIRSVESDTLRLEWRTTTYPPTGPALTSGMATLVRRNN